MFAEKSHHRRTPAGRFAPAEGSRVLRKLNYKRIEELACPMLFHRIIGHAIHKGSLRAAATNASPPGLILTNVTTCRNHAGLAELCMGRRFDELQVTPAECRTVYHAVALQN